jgi:hypothetical protein
LTIAVWWRSNWPATTAVKWSAALLLRHLFQQVLGIAGRHQEADQFAIEALGDVDAGHRAIDRHAGAAAHAGVDRAGEHQLVVEAARDHAVVGAFGNREAEVERIAHRVQVLALRQARQLFRHLEEAGAVAVDAQHGQVVQHIDRQQFDIAALAAGVDPFADVGVGIERELGHHVVVGQHQVAGADQKAGADRGLRAAALQQRAHLQDVVLGGGIQVLGGAGGRRQRGVGIRRRPPAAGAARLALAGGGGRAAGCRWRYGCGPVAGALAAVPADEPRRSGPQRQCCS